MTRGCCLRRRIKHDGSDQRNGCLGCPISRLTGEDKETALTFVF